VASRFRKIPVVIEAVRWDGKGSTAEEIGFWSNNAAVVDRSGDTANLVISTLEGRMTANKGDWIIKGVAGEFYACKPAVFAATYEPAD
jgi:hypothetical protein